MDVVWIFVRDEWLFFVAHTAQKCVRLFAVSLKKCNFAAKLCHGAIFYAF